MDQINEIIDNIVIPFITIHGLTLLLTFFLLLVVYPFFVNNEIKEETLEERYTMENLRDYIENNKLTMNDKKNCNKILQSVVLPKKGDYVIINDGRWEGYIGRITNILDYLTHNLYNIKISKRDNIHYGNDIPKFLLKDKDRNFFSVLTDKEIYDYGLLDQNEYMSRYLITNY